MGYTVNGPSVQNRLLYGFQPLYCAAFMLLILKPFTGIILHYLIWKYPSVVGEPQDRRHHLELEAASEPEYYRRAI